MELVKLNISLFLCHMTTSPQIVIIEDDSTRDTGSDDIDPPKTVRGPLIKNVLGDNLYSSLHNLFHASAIEDTEQFEDNETKSSEPSDPCDYSLSSVELSLTKEGIFVCVTLLVFVVIAILVCHKSKRFFISRFAKFKKKQPVKDKDKIDNGEVTESCLEETDVSKVDVNSEIGSSRSETPHQESLKLFQTIQSKRMQHFFETDISKFLDETTNRLFSKLDRLLLKGSSSLDQTQSAIATPRLARRPISRRQRVGSSPSLPIQTASSDTSSNNTEKTMSWEQLKHYYFTLGLAAPRSLYVDANVLNRSSQKLVHYYQRVCPISRDTWKATVLIVNFVLYLIKSELENIAGKSSSPYRFLKFECTDSSKFGTKVTRVSKFEVVMHVQMPFSTDFVIHDAESIPSGFVVLASDKHGLDSDMGMMMDINGQKAFCLSSKHCLRGVEELIDECLQSLHSQTRTAMDRLPFHIRKAPVPELTLNVDTRALVGLGETDIKISVTPVVSLVTDGVFQMPLLYAAPVPEWYESDFRSVNHKTVRPEFLWKLRYDDYETAFCDGIERNMLTANVKSCFPMCLMILKAVLTGCNRNSLLDRGVLPESHISNVLYFLLLESEPRQWTYDKLGDRFSDVVHFIRDAYTNGRLPNFFMNNPHLTGKMPSAARNVLLKRKRQENLLADWTRENLEKCLDYLKDRLREVGLADCIHEEYSTDMWEYEFFLFN